MLRFTPSMAAGITTRLFDVSDLVKLRAKIQGFVEVEIVVGTLGTVERARVTRSLDQKLGLDEQA